jgi:1-acyl-sn-glycerol-3-phosphate acyltransferase
MTVVFDRPYQFVPPHRGNLWPTLIQRLRIVDRYLKKREGVFEYEGRGLQHLKASLDRGDGILLAPNHCRYADPLVLGWPARELRTHVFAMASWHLFNKGEFDSFAIRKMGGFSIHREGVDRQSLEIAIEILATAERPLIVFPEGTTNRTNDLLKPLLDGVSFIARSAARRRAKSDGGRVVMHPVAIKYLCIKGFDDWADRQLAQLERHIGWQQSEGRTILQRSLRLAEAMLALKEVEYLGETRCGGLSTRRDQLIRQLLADREQRLGMEPQEDDVRSRVRAIRTAVASRYFASSEDPHEQARLRNDAAAADLAQELASYPDCYLQGDGVTDTRIIETIQRMQETFLGRVDVSVPLRAVVECGEAIEVPPERAPRGQSDPLLDQLREQLTSMISRLSQEARPITNPKPNP